MITLWTFTCIYRCKQPCMPYMCTVDIRYSFYQIFQNPHQPTAPLIQLPQQPSPRGCRPPWTPPRPPSWRCPRCQTAIASAAVSSKKKHTHPGLTCLSYIFTPLKTNKRPLKSDHFSTKYIFGFHRFSGDMLVFRGVIVIQSLIGGGIPIQSTLIGEGIPIQSWIGGADSPFFGQKSWLKYPMNDLGFGKSSAIWLMGPKSNAGVDNCNSPTRESTSCGTSQQRHGGPQRKLSTRLPIDFGWLWGIPPKPQRVFLCLHFRPQCW